MKVNTLNHLTLYKGKISGSFKKYLQKDFTNHLIHEKGDVLVV